MSEQFHIGVIPKDESTAVFIKLLKSLKGNRVDIRVHYRLGANWRRGTSGVTFKQKQIDELIELLQKARTFNSQDQDEIRPIPDNTACPANT